MEKNTKATAEKANSVKRKANDIGAPSQKTQPTRKGKKAWRKNVDIADIEQAIEGFREEERVTGGKLQDKSDAELFQVDVKGDEEVRKRIQKEKKPLRFMQVLGSRSAVPAVHSRAPTTKSSKIRLTHEEKAKLLQKTRRLRRGALNSYLEPIESGSTVIEPRVTGKYDVWNEMPSDDEKVVKRLKTNEAKDYIFPLVQRPKIKPPLSLELSKDIALPAVTLPHPGTSYNPLAESHQSLLRSAHEIELAREAEAEKWRAEKERLEALKRKRVDASEEEVGTYRGMVVDVPEEDDVEEELEESAVVVPVRKMPGRKTTSQRAKAARLLAEKRALAEKAARKRLLASISSLKKLTRSKDDVVSSRSKMLLAQKEKERAEGLAGRRVGKHVVPEKVTDVQLTSELSESLRALQPEGNLFKDRFLSLQHRALVEPRLPVLAKRKTKKLKEYEKHPFKRFS